MIDDPIVFPFMESFHFSRQTMAINDGTWEVGSESLSWGGVCVRTCVRAHVCACVCTEIEGGSSKAPIILPGSYVLLLH